MSDDPVLNKAMKAFADQRVIEWRDRANKYEQALREIIALGNRRAGNKLAIRMVHTARAALDKPDQM